MRPADVFIAAVRHHQAGQFAEADRLYRKVLAPSRAICIASPARCARAPAGRNADAVKLIGAPSRSIRRFRIFITTLGLRSGRSAAGRKRGSLARAIALNPNFVEARLNLGNALREEGRFGAMAASLAQRVAGPHAMASLAKADESGRSAIARRFRSRVALSGFRASLISRVLAERGRTTPRYDAHALEGLPRAAHCRGSAALRRSSD